MISLGLCVRQTRFAQRRMRSREAACRPRLFRFFRSTVSSGRFARRVRCRRRGAGRGSRSEGACARCANIAASQWWFTRKPYSALARPPFGSQFPPPRGVGNAWRCPRIARASAPACLREARAPVRRSPALPGLSRAAAEGGSLRRSQAAAAGKANVRDTEL